MQLLRKSRPRLCPRQMLLRCAPRHSHPQTHRGHPRHLPRAAKCWIKFCLTLRRKRSPPFGVSFASAYASRSILLGLSPTPHWILPGPANISLISLYKRRDAGNLLPLKSAVTAFPANGLSASSSRRVVPRPFPGKRYGSIRREAPRGVGSGRGTPYPPPVWMNIKRKDLQNLHFVN